MENNKCPKCNSKMQFNIQLEYDHSPYYCTNCGYAEGCSNFFSEESCSRCTEHFYCKRWFDINNKSESYDSSIPSCRECHNLCTDLEEYIESAKIEEIPVIDYVKSDGTYTRKDNTFICSPCYVKGYIEGKWK